MTGDEERCLAAGMDTDVARPIEAKRLFASPDALPGSSAEELPDVVPVSTEAGL